MALLMIFANAVPILAQCPICQTSETGLCVLWSPGYGTIYVSTGEYFDGLSWPRYRQAWANAGNNWSAVQSHLQFYEAYPPQILWDNARLGPGANDGVTLCNWTLPDSWYTGCRTTINDDLAPARSDQFLQWLAAHEFGHSLSLNDSNNPGCLCTTAMYGFMTDPPCITGPTGLDVNAINFLYQ